LTNSDAENAETQTWSLFAYKCEYIDKVTYEELNYQSLEVGEIINYMITNPEKFGTK